jgi:tetratricopeptide (TPR) repeat protein
LTNLLIEIRKHSKKLYEIDNYFDLSSEELDQIANDDSLFHEQSHYEDRLWEIKSKIFQRLSRQGNARTKFDLEFYKEFYKEFENIIEPKISTFEGQYLKLHIQSVYYFSINQLTESYQYLRQNHQLFIDDTVQINDHPNRFFSILTNLIYTADKLGHYQEATNYLSELRLLHSNIQENAYQDLRAKLFATLASIELTYHTKRGEYDFLAEKIPKLEQEIIQYESGLSILRKAFIHFKISTIHLAMGDSSAALKSIRKLLNESNLDKKEDIVGYAHLLEIFIQLEIGRHDLIPHLVKVTQRFLKAKSRYGEFEKEIVASCLRISQTSNFFDQKEKWGHLAEKLATKMEQSIEQQSTEYFHWHLWAKAKADDKNYVQLVQEISQQALYPAA